MDTIKFDRRAYMARECSFQAYYGQFATPAVQSLVRGRIGLKRIMASTDESFNDIPLREWDAMHGTLPDSVIRALCESNSSTYANGAKVYSLSDTVCVVKAAARLIKDNMAQVD